MALAMTCNEYYLEHPISHYDNASNFGLNIGSRLATYSGNQKTDVLKMEYNLRYAPGVGATKRQNILRNECC